MKQITETGTSTKELNALSPKHISELELLIMQIIKTMRMARLQDYPIYTVLQVLERDLGEIRRQRYDENHSHYEGY